MTSRLRNSFMPRLLMLALLAIVLSNAQPALGSVPTDTAIASLLPEDAELRDMPVAAQIAAIVVGTLLSEDLVCIAVGMLIRREQISPWVGGIGCFIGIYIGDLLFFLIGRAGGVGLLKMKFVSQRMSAERLQAFGAWFDRRPWAAIAMCRVMPGIRVPLYLAVGALTKRTSAFFWWTCFFAFIWTPILIGLVVLFGDIVVAPFEAFLGGGWKPTLLAILTIFLFVRLVMLMATKAGRVKLLNSVGRLWGRQPVEIAEDPVPPAVVKETSGA